MGQQCAECEVGLQAGGVTDQNMRHVRGKFPDALSATSAGGAQLASITTGNGNFDDLAAGFSGIAEIAGDPGRSPDAAGKHDG